MANSIALTVRVENPSGATGEVLKNPYLAYVPSNAIRYRPYVGNDAGSYSIVDLFMPGSSGITDTYAVAETVATIVSRCNA